MSARRRIAVHWGPQPANLMRECGVLLVRRGSRQRGFHDTAPGWACDLIEQWFQLALHGLAYPNGVWDALEYQTPLESRQAERALAVLRQALTVCARVPRRAQLAAAVLALLQLEGVEAVGAFLAAQPGWPGRPRRRA